MTIALDDIDIASHDTYVNGVPHDLFVRLRHEAPVFRHRASEPEQPGFFWVVTRHPDVIKVSRAFDQYSSAAKGCLLIDERADLEIARMLIDLDPPEHTRQRSRVNKVFTPRALRALDGHYRTVSADLIDDALAQGSFDFVTQVAAELPLIAIAELMGIPLEDRHKVFDWSNRMVGSNDPEYGDAASRDAEAAMGELYLYAAELAGQRKMDPRDDIITKLLTAEGAEALSDDEFNLFVLLLAVAGNETTRNAISHGMLALIEHPDSWSALQADPGLLDGAIEEILRWASPVMQFRRTATGDVELHGQHIAKGDPVVMYYISANRDEAVFDDPFAFDITRSPNPHIAFGGGGHHFCLGANLARLEARVALTSLVKRVREVEVEHDRCVRVHSLNVRGFAAMPTSVTVR
jgi:cholest-4-en-3-one 26-monooxygenase